MKPGLFALCGYIPLIQLHTLTYMSCVPQGDIQYKFNSYVSCTACTPLGKRGKCTFTLIDRNTHMVNINRSNYIKAPSGNTIDTVKYDTFFNHGPLSLTTFLPSSAITHKSRIANIFKRKKHHTRQAVFHIYI